MSNKISEINIKHFTSCFFDDVMNIKNLDPKSRCEISILIYFIGHVTVKVQS